MQVFQREEIRLDVLPMLSDQQLKAVGVMSLGARLAIRRVSIVPLCALLWLCSVHSHLFYMDVQIPVLE